jgi:hypothetical protein
VKPIATPALQAVRRQRGQRACQVTLGQALTTSVKWADEVLRVRERATIRSATCFAGQLHQTPRTVPLSPSHSCDLAPDQCGFSINGGLLAEPPTATPTGMPNA